MKYSQAPPQSTIFGNFVILNIVKYILKSQLHVSEFNAVFSNNVNNTSINQNSRNTYFYTNTYKCWWVVSWGPQTLTICSRVARACSTALIEFQWLLAATNSNANASTRVASGVQRLLANAEYRQPHIRTIYLNRHQTVVWSFAMKVHFYSYKSRDRPTNDID